MSFKDFLKACSEETNSGDIAGVDTTICDSSKKPRCLTKRKAVKEENCNSTKRKAVKEEDCCKDKDCKDKDIKGKDYEDYEDDKDMEDDKEDDDDKDDEDDEDDDD